MRSLQPCLLRMFIAAMFVGICVTARAGDEARPLLNLHFDAASEVTKLGGRIVGNGAFVPGRTGKAFRFPGGDMRIEIPAAGHFRGGEGTVEMWIKIESIPAADKRVYLFDLLGTPNWWNRFVGSLATKQGRLSAEFVAVPDNGMAPTLHPNIEGPVENLASEWVHYAATWVNLGPGQTASALRLYINGVEVARWTGAGVPVTMLGETLWIGNAILAQTRDEKPPVLLMDEFTVWDRALSPETILARSGRPAMQSSPRSFARVRPTQQPIAVDGVVAADEWGMAQSVGLFRQLHDAAGRLDPLATTAWITYDDEALYVAWQCKTTEPRPAGEARARDGSVWMDDSMEVLLVSEQRPGALFHVISNAYGSLYDERLEGGKDDPAWNAPWKYSARWMEGRWEGELRIAFGDLGLRAPRSGERWRLNVCRTSISPSCLSMWSYDSRGFVHADGLGEIEFTPAGAAVSSQSASQIAAGENLLNLTLANGAGKESRVRVGLFSQRVGASAEAPRWSIAQYVLGENARSLDAPSMFTVADAGPNHACLVVQDTTGAPVYQQPFAFDALPKLVVRAFPDFPTGQVRVVVDAARVPGGPFTGTVELAPTGAAPAIRTTALDRFEGHTEVVLSLDGLPSGDYRIVATLKNAGGQEVASRSEQLVVVARPPFMDAKAGLAGVLPPWTPVKRTGSVVECWGRSYTFDGSPLPTRIVSNGGEVLTGPVQFSYRLPGHAQSSLSRGNVEFAATTDASAGFTGTMADASFNVKTQGRVDYDGTVIYSMTVTPARPVQVDAFDLVIPLHPDAAQYLLDGWASRFSEEKNAIPRQPGGVLRTPYLSQFGVSGENRGIQWFSESDEGWTPYDRPDVIALEREADRVLLRMTIKKNVLFDKPLRLSAGFLATPARPAPTPGAIPKVVHYWPGGPYFQDDKYDYRIDLLDEFKRYGGEVVMMHVYWAKGFGNVEPIHPERFRMFIDRAHELNMRVVVYVGGLVNDGVPARRFFGDPWLVLPRTGFTHRPGERVDISSEVVCAAPETFHDWLVGGLKLLMETYGVDGFYYDWGVSGCRNGVHGCGYQAGEESVAQPKVGDEEHIVGIAVQDTGDSHKGYRRTYPVLAQRRLWQRLYGITREVKGDRGIIVAHSDEGGQGTYLVYSDLVWHSEDVACHMPPDTFPTLTQYRFLMSKRNLGLGGYLLSYDRWFPTNDAALAFSMLHGEAVMPLSKAVPTYLPEEHFVPVKAVWDAWDAFGVKDSTWEPYWTNSRLVKDEPSKNIRVSLWRKAGAWLMVVSNLEQKPQTAQVQIVDKTMLPARATDAITGEKITLDGASLTVPLPGARMRLIRLEHVK